LPELSATAGLDFYGQFLNGRYRGPAPGQYEGNPSESDSFSTQRNVSTVQPSIDVVRPGAYLEFGFRPTPRLLFVPGLRADYYGDVAHASLDPRLTARYQVTDQITLKSGLGFYTQAPQYWQALAVVGNPRIDPSRALHSSLGFELRASEQLKLSAEGFYKRLTHRIVGTANNAEPHWVNDGDGRIFGAEFLAEYRAPSGTFGYLAYTISRSERRDAGGPMRLFDHDQPHLLSLALSQRLGRGWTIGGRFRLTSGEPIQEYA
jgi:outer membrane cobalamin receptor